MVIVWVSRAALSKDELKLFALSDVQDKQGTRTLGDGW